MAYAEKTSISFERSIGEIIGMVRGKGASQIAQMDQGNLFVLAFDLDGRQIRFSIPLLVMADMPLKDGRNSTIPPSRRVEMAEQARRQKGRALMLVIKAKLESIESKVETLEEAFLANVVLADNRTVYERTHDIIAIEYETGKVQPLMLGAPS
jgi:hypothetical protein